MKIIKKFMLSLFIFISIFSFNYISTVHAAETNNQGELEEFTNSDSFSYNNNIYNIGDYASSIEDTTILFSSNCDLDIKMVVNGDDPIIKIIPKHLFMETNTTTYVGKEYGFFI